MLVKPNRGQELHESRSNAKTKLNTQNRKAKKMKEKKLHKNKQIRGKHTKKTAKNAETFTKTETYAHLSNLFIEILNLFEQIFM